MAFSMVDLGKVLVRQYLKTVPDSTHEEWKFLNMIKKDNDFVGDYLVSPIKYGKQQGRSRTWTDADANRGNPKWDRFLIDVVADHCLASVPQEAVFRCKDKGALVTMFADEIDDQISALDQNLEASMFRSTTGARAAVAHTAAINQLYLQLATPEDIELFETGMVVKLGAVGGAVEAGQVTLGTIDRELGRIWTSNAAVWNDATNIPTIAVDMLIYQEGDINASISGLESWLLTASPTPGVTFFGVDRYIDPRLYGTYQSATAGLPIEEQIKRGLSKCMRRGGKPNVVFLHTDAWTDLEISLLNRIRYGEAKSIDGKYGYKGIIITAQGRDVVCLSSPFCQRYTAWGLETDTWHLTFMGPKAGSTVWPEASGQLITSSGNNYDIRCGNWAQLYTTKPGNNVRIALA